MTRRPPRRRRTALYAGIGLACLFGCQVLVSSDVPEFTCTGIDPSNCPEGTTCDAVRGRCVPPSDEGDSRPPLPPEDASDSNAPPPSLGKPCANALDCPGDLFCGNTSALTKELLGASEQPICTKPCCSSADCPDEFVCFGAGTGGNYCVSATRARRAPIGATEAGGSCTKGADCRSGLCQDDHCVDSCCSSSDCASDSVCRKTTVAVPPPTKETWSCAAPIRGATLDFGQTCSGADAGVCPPEAQTGNCCENQNCGGVPRECRPSCCGPNDCEAAGGDFGICAYATFGNTDSQTKFCIDRGSVLGTGKAGDSCNKREDCATFVCDPDTKKCTTACCQDKDCPPTDVCRPASTGILRCLPKPN